MKILLDMVGYGVRDMAAMLRFYRLLGLPLAPELDNEAFAECITANGCRLGWNHIDMEGAHGRPGLLPEFLTQFTYYL